MEGLTLRLPIGKAAAAVTRFSAPIVMPWDAGTLLQAFYLGCKANSLRCTHLCKPQAARSASKTGTGTRTRQHQGQRRAACRQKPRPKRQLTCSFSQAPLHKRFKARRDTDAISHDRANPRSGPVRGLGSLTNCAHPASRPALRAPTPNWTATRSRPHVRDNGCRLELHKEKEESDAGALLKKCTLKVWVAWFCYFDE